MNTKNLTEKEIENEGLLIEELSTLPEKAILDESLLAKILRVTPRTIRRMVVRGELPVSIPLAGRSVWVVGQVLEYIENSAHNAQKDAIRNQRRLDNLSPPD